MNEWLSCIASIISACLLNVLHFFIFAENNKFGGVKMATAKIGDSISFKRDGKSYEGSVTVVRENSVIVKYGYNKEKNEPITTIVNHKNYKIK